MRNKNLVRWLYGCLIFFTTACHYKADSFISTDNTSILKKRDSLQLLTKLDSLKQLIKSGDIITRTGNDFTSQSLKTLNRKNKTFSHCGIASIENDTLFIYHAIGGEWNPDQKIKRENFEAFTNPVENNMMGIYRYSILHNVRNNLIKTVKHFYRSNIVFDMAFDLKTNDKMYCAEFVYKSIRIASSNKIIFNHSFIKNFEFVGVDDITENALSKKIASLNYKLY